MKIPRILLVLFAVTICTQGGGYVAPNALIVTEKSVCVTEEAEKKLRFLDPHTLTSLAEISLPDVPSGITEANGKLYVTCGRSRGQLLEIDPDSKKILRTLEIGHWPQAPSATADGKFLYLANRFSSQAASVNLDSMQLVWQNNAGREPIAALPAPNGKVYLPNHLPMGSAGRETHQAAVVVLHGATGEKCSEILLPDGSQGIRGGDISPDGTYVVVSHVVSHYNLPTTHIDRGWINTNAISLIRTADDTLYATILLDDVNHGAANPWAVLFTPDGKKLLVSIAGNHELFVIDFPALLQKITSAPPQNNQLSYLGNLRSRLSLPLNGPRAIAIGSSGIYVAGYYSDNLIRISPGRRPRVIASQDLPGAEAGDMSRLGEKYFNDATLCRENWQSCASCHPDGRVDALNWDMLNDGIGNPKNTRTMFLSHKTPPVMSLGIRKNAETAVRAGFRYIEFNEPIEEYCQAIDFYLDNMSPVSSPFLQPADLQGKPFSENPECLQCHTLERGKLSPKAQKGKALFVGKANCATCHPHPLFTNLELYDVGTATGRDEGKKIRTPSLVEVWRTGPYLHDGRAATLKEAITTFNPHDRRGNVSTLSEDELDELLAYLESL